MILTYDPSSNEFVINYDDINQKRSLSYHYKKKLKNWRFRSRGNPGWDGVINFMSRGGNAIPVGLWKDCMDHCKRLGYDAKFVGLKEVFNDISKEDFTNFCNELMKDHEYNARPVQIAAAYKIIKYNYCLGHLSMNAGKTLILYLVVSYLLHKGRYDKVLIVCPDSDLVIQMYDDFDDYSCGRWRHIKPKMIHGKIKKKDRGVHDANVIIGNFQTLKNADDDFFLHFGGLYVDEVHRAKAASIKDIIYKTKNVNTRAGVSGTILAEDNADYYTLLANFGPVVCTLTEKDLTDLGYATPIRYNPMLLDYASDDFKLKLSQLRSRADIDNKDVFHIEMKNIRTSQKRIFWIAEFLSRLQGNTIVFFIDIKTGYGKRLKDATATLCNKSIFYADGQTPKENRAIIKRHLENNTDSILFATYATYSTGKSINNLHNAVLAESIKDYNTFSQTLGRLLRLHESKDVADVYDISDDLRCYETGFDMNNYSYRHMTERIRLSRAKGYDVRKTTKVNLQGSQSINGSFQIL